MKTHDPINSKIMAGIGQTADKFYALAQAGDKAAHVKWAFASAIYDTMAKGYKLTDCSWFAGSKYYTGHDPAFYDAIKQHYTNSDKPLKSAA